VDKQLVGSNRQNGIKKRTPPTSSNWRKNSKGPVSTSVKQSIGYITVKGIQSETSYQEPQWPLFALKESMDNAYDALNSYYLNCGKETRKINVHVKIDPISSAIVPIPKPTLIVPETVITHIIRIAVRNSNVDNVSVFENVEEIFDFNIWYSSKRNQHRMTCGSLGDFLKRVLGMGYASWTSNQDSDDSFEDKQWEEPVILRFNGQERKAFIIVEDQSTPYADVKKPIKYDASDFTEVEIALPLFVYWNNRHGVLLSELERYYRIYKLAKTKIDFSFCVIGRESTN
jgi:hypothetical protein